MNGKRSVFSKTMLLTLAAGCWMAGSAHAETDKYRLAWTDDPATTMTIGWCQASGAPVEVRYGTDPSLATFSTDSTITTRVYDNSVHVEGPALESHFVNLNGLAPDTAYYFTITDSEGDSEIMWFKTAPDTPAEFTFIAGGDSRTNAAPRQWGNELISKVRPLFVAHGGDYEDDVTNLEMANWLDEWQLTRSTDGRMYPVIPAHGNHENDMTDFVQKIFNMDNPDGYYAMNIGGAMMRLYTLNTELEPGVGYSSFSDQDDTKWNAQAAWLFGDMQVNSEGTTWLVANYHRPMRPHQSGKTEGLGRIAAWADTFYNHGLDLAIECDSHLTKYTFPLAPSSDPGSFESFVRDDADGTVFIGEGSWGAPHRANDDDKPWTLASDSFWQFNLVQASPANLHIRKVKFGQYDSANNPLLGYDMNDVSELTQAEQDSNPFALPAGLDLWQPLAGETLTLPFTGADVDNVEYVTTGGAWKYLDNGSDQGTAWKEASFDDSSWSSGPAQLGYGDGDETTVISYGPDENNKYPTTYFRNTFTVGDPGQLIKLKLMLLRDDGAVVYINGNEVVRSNMPEGDVASTTLAKSSIGGTAESTFYQYHIDPAVLVAGNNTIAVELHQSSSSSSDLSFDLSLYGVESNVSGPAPAAPADLAGNALSTSEIEISWTDNAASEVGYEVWRRTGDNAWEIYQPDLDADSAGYKDIMLAENTTYSYKVRAFSQYGLSGFSDEVTVATQATSTPSVWSQDFELDTFGDMSTVSVTSNFNWQVYTYSGARFARMNGYGADEASSDWLITPEFDLYGYSGEYITFDLAYNYSGPELEVLVADNYDADVHVDPGDAHWRSLGATLPPVGGYTWENGGELSFDLASVDFEDDTTGSFTSHSRASNADWTIGERAGQKGIIANGYGADEASDDWLISPVMEVGAGAEIEIDFDLYRKYDGPDLQVMVSSDYSGSGDPMTANWTSYPVSHDDIWDEWKPVSVRFTDQSGNVHVAFRYVSTGTGGGDGARLGLDNIVIQPTSVHVAYHYISTGTGGGDGRIWEVDNIELRANPYSFLFEDFNEDLLADTTFTAISLASNADWIIEERAEQKGAIANSYGADSPSDDWLVSPAMHIAPDECAELVFDHYRKYDGPALEVKISTDYAGDISTATWDTVTVNHDDIDDEWKTRTIDLCDYSGTVHVAFHYTSTGTGPGDGARIGIDNVRVARKVVTELGVNFSADQTLCTTADELAFYPYINGGVSPYSFLWDFGNGDTSTEESPFYTYPAAGTYTVSFTVTDSEQQSASSVQTDYITVAEADNEAVISKVGDLRVATFNILFAWREAAAQGRLITYLADPNWDQAQKVAEIIQRAKPDMILLNEFNYDENGEAISLFKQNYLEISQNGADPIVFDYHFIAPSNTGIPSGVDFNNDGDTTDPEDCFGYGNYPGAYGMAVLSQYPIDTQNVRTFQTFLWKDMPDNEMPTSYYSQAAQDVFRLSSKSHWDVPVSANGQIIHMLCSHPTPPVFDDGDAAQGAVDWNGRRNHDEIRFWADYVTPGAGNYIYDDAGVNGGLGVDQMFVILGDENADPDEGDSYDNAIDQLLSSSTVNISCVPSSSGALDETGDADDTASWGLRADYALPSTFGLLDNQCGVFWPALNDVNYHLVANDASSDHRMVWVDISIDDGDLNFDGVIDINDLFFMRDYLRQPAESCPECDIDGDGVITIRDARKLARMCDCPRCRCQ